MTREDPPDGTPPVLDREADPEMRTALIAAGELPISEELARLLADNTVGLFLEYRDTYGWPEDDARAAAVRDVAEAATLQLPRPPLTAESLRVLAKRAITDRLGYWQASSIRAVITDDDGGLEIRLNSGGNWQAVAAALASAGYRYDGNPAHDVLAITIPPPQG